MSDRPAAPPASRPETGSPSRALRDGRAGAARRTVDEDGVVRIDAGPRGAGRSRGRTFGVAALVAVVIAGGVLGVIRLRSTPVAGPPAPPGALSAPGGAAAPARAGSGRRGTIVGSVRAGDGITGGARSGAREALSGPGGPEPDDEEEVESERGAEAAGDGVEGAPAEAAASGRGPLGMPAHGSKKIKVGLVVPEDFELPAGYVRHYQTTDKGQMLPAILMFHPDFTPVDAQGRPVAVPEDRVVPPDLAPPGMPQSWLDVPEDAYSKPDDPAPPTEAEKAAAEAAAEEDAAEEPHDP